MENQLAELVHFLHDPKPEVRQLAIQHVSGLQAKAQKVIPDIMALCEDDPITAHDALKALINLSGDETLRSFMSSSDFIVQLMKMITSPTHVLADLAFGAIAVPPVDGLSTSARALTQLLEVFNKQYNKQADYHFLASVFANITLTKDGRAYFLEEDAEQGGMLPIVKLICFTEHPAVIRRGGVIVTIKNCCFDVSKQAILLSDDWKREADDHLRTTLLETILLLASTRAGREVMRQRKVYPIIKTLHLAESNDKIKDVIEEIVQLNIRSNDDKEHRLSSCN
ncbi:hypothetical protein BDF22DRAFT_675923 [Syncephalis plumigaleata]|nr:hypothetical protein BDF22DRAFT_675923 [Syncephalis plumigaleata]